MFFYPSLLYRVPSLHLWVGSKSNRVLSLARYTGVSCTPCFSVNQRQLSLPPLLSIVFWCRRHVTTTRFSCIYSRNFQIAMVVRLASFSWRKLVRWIIYFCITGRSVVLLREPIHSWVVDPSRNNFLDYRSGGRSRSLWLVILPRAWILPFAQMVYLGAVLWRGCGGAAWV